MTVGLAFGGSSRVFAAAAIALVACAGADGIAGRDLFSGTSSDSTREEKSLVPRSPPSGPPPSTGFNVTCSGPACVLDAAAAFDGSPVTVWDWSFGDGTGAVRTSPTTKKIYSGPGIFSVSLTMTNALGATATFAKVDTVTAEPIGMTRLAENNFSCIASCQNNWYVEPGYAGAVSIVRDPTAPKGDSSVVQQNFTSLLPGGSSPASIGTGLSQKQTIYVSMWMKMSPNYFGHPTGVNKVLHFWTRNGRNVAVFIIRGAGNGPLQASFNLQGLSLPYTWLNGGSSVNSTEANLDANLGSCPVNRGQWHHYEMVLSNSQPAYSDGRIQYWLDGVKCGDFQNIGFVGLGQNNRWEEISWSPTWGGTGGNITDNFFTQLDYIYVSGK